MGENIKDCTVLDYNVIRPIDNPYSQTGGIAVLKGNLAPDGSVVKRSAVAKKCCSTKALQRFITVRKRLLRLFIQVRL